MANMTNEQIEAKKKQLKQLTDEAKAIYDELVAAGAIAISDDDLDKAVGGCARYRSEIDEWMKFED